MNVKNPHLISNGVASERALYSVRLTGLEYELARYKEKNNPAPR